MSKSIAAAAFMSLMLCSAASANTISSASSAGGLNVPAASEAIQVTGSNHGSNRGATAAAGMVGLVCTLESAAATLCTPQEDAVMPPEPAVTGADAVAVFTDMVAVATDMTAEFI